MAIDWNYYGLERFTEEMPYELGYVEKLLDKTLRKYGEKLSGFDNTNFYEAKTEEIGKRVCHITSERFVLPIGEKTDSVEESTIIYYRSVPILNLAEDEFYSREMLKKFLPYRDTSTIEHIGIKSKDSDTEMVITFDGRDKDDNCEFENLEFQLKLKKQYDSSEFREVFERKGVKLVSMDVGGTLEYSKEQAREFYRVFLR